MRILLTNDDGINAPGLNVLAAELAKIADIFIVAPDQERSASSHSITFSHPLRATPVDMPWTPKAWHINGTPADCVKIAINSLLGFKPDLVVSGINSGPNLGSDVLYSGTVAAAVEGYINGVAGIAVSLNAFTQGDYQQPAIITSSLVQIMQKDNMLGPKMLANINFPKDSQVKLSDVCITSLGERKYENVYDLRTDPRGREYYWLAGDIVNPVIPTGAEILTDIEVVLSNRISMTPLHIDLTNYDSITRLDQWIRHFRIP